MSTRERWIVYPLVFLTLGIALKDKVTRFVITDNVECRRLTVTDREGRPRVILMPTQDGGIVEARAADSSVNVIMGQFNSRWGIMVADADNKLLPLIGGPLGRPRRSREPQAGKVDVPPDLPTSDKPSPTKEPREKVPHDAAPLERP